MRKVISIAGSLSTLIMFGCTPAVYRPPETPKMNQFSRDLNASFDGAWAAVTEAAGASFFKIQNFDKGSGLMTLEYEDMGNNAGSYVTCGTVESRVPRLGGVTPEPNSILNYALTQITLSGRANITAKQTASNRTIVTVNSQYKLVGLREVDKVPKVEAVWNFTSREPSTQKLFALVSGNVAVTCQPTFKLENELLTAIEARVSAQDGGAPAGAKTGGKSRGRKKR